MVVLARTDVRRSGGRTRAGGEFDRLCEGGYSGVYAKRWFEFTIHYADYQITGAFSAGLNVIAIGDSIARGNENNLHTPNGTRYFGEGKAGGYTIFNLSAQYRVDKQLKFFAQINNLFDCKYNTAAQLGPNGFTANGSFIARPFPAVAGEFPVQQATFYAPGAPRTAWIGVRYQFDMPPTKN